MCDEPKPATQGAAYRGFCLDATPCHNYNISWGLSCCALEPFEPTVWETARGRAGPPGRLKPKGLSTGAARVSAPAQGNPRLAVPGPLRGGSPASSQVRPGARPQSDRNAGLIPINRDPVRTDRFRADAQRVPHAPEASRRCRANPHGSGKSCCATPRHVGDAELGAAIGLPWPAQTNGRLLTYLDPVHRPHRHRAR